MNLIFLAGLTPFGYGFIGVLLLSFILAYFWLKSNKKESKPGCVSIGFAGIIIWFVLMFPTFITFSVIENGNTAAKIGTGIFWFLVLLLILYFKFAKNTASVKNLIFTFFKYLFYLIVLGLFLVLFFGMAYYVYQRLFTTEKNEDPVWPAFLCIFFLASLILAGFGLLNKNKEETKKVKSTFYNLKEAKLKPESVVELDLSKSKLNQFPLEILGFKNLKFLILSHNEISEIPNDINKLHKLIGLDLSHNPISDAERNKIRRLLSNEVEIVF
ncbi:leucine-rich repeat domain-containing protein [Flavobacterium johnsoniae]|uniref:Leucine Rich repeat-containing protein n=1 Tax=Flavobacterium johnsoniae TaxID=986 RepID=A0A1M5H6S5_FLAJO|nr:leucine-rich repeat domain-containing protein [Flavobacterium johnsoniae]SHG11605.1 Leucine Rich repeat-containing protein [Flavobacterium johnsoniae]